ncbi:hypothetical protein M0R45_019643 [Rubus argutus]|uniref:Uncharacterized protein n=1 Tax=Rubus argutus TaxID=59490 RepID=A0AAW1X798_RUBAR
MAALTQAHNQHHSNHPSNCLGHPEPSTPIITQLSRTSPSHLIAPPSLYKAHNHSQSHPAITNQFLQFSSCKVVPRLINFSRIAKASSPSKLSYQFQFNSIHSQQKQTIAARAAYNSQTGINHHKTTTKSLP